LLLRVYLLLQLDPIFVTTGMREGPSFPGAEIGAAVAAAAGESSLTEEAQGAEEIEQETKTAQILFWGTKKTVYRKRGTSTYIVGGPNSQEDYTGNCGTDTFCGYQEDCSIKCPLQESSRTINY
jgi:hypothetical protein